MLSQVIAAVNARLTAALEDPTVNQPIPTFAIGSDRLAVEDAPPRIVWVPMRGPVRGPHSQGGNGVLNPRPLRTRHEGLQVHIWACEEPRHDGSGDLQATETLMNHFIAALNDTIPGCWDCTATDWTTNQVSATRLGMVCVLDIEIQVPLTREPDTYALVTTMPEATSFVPTA